MPKVTREYIERKKKHIVDSTYQLCLEKTVSTVTMQDIINRTGLCQGGIYRFFKDIDEILAAMLVDLRGKVDFKGMTDQIFEQDREVTEVLEAVFDMLADFMEAELLGIEKINFEINVLAMNEPKRMQKILGQIDEEGNFAYLIHHITSYVQVKTAKGELKPQIGLNELIAFISSAYSGIRMDCIVLKCYQPGKEQRDNFVDARVQLHILARTVNFLLGNTNEIYNTSTSI